ncbi:ABC transporter permease [Allofournierella sp.]|uniref:ABC transporter permease n=1 Tax=Allofournierella sp. TaxID=1940256 RepID=UPI003AB3F910
MIWENIKLALSGLMTNKMRALLTMLGIIIGIGSVIAIVTVGNSLTSSVSDSLVSLGGNNLQVAVNQRPDENGNYSNSVSYYEEDLLSDEMLDSLRQRFSQQIKALIIANYGGSGKAQDGRLYANLQTVGVNPDFFVADKVDMVAGRALRESDMEGARKVAVVSDLVVDNMFGGDANAALGKTISLASGNEVNEYAIVGVYHYELQGIFLGGAGPTTSKDTTTEMYVPSVTMKEEWGDRYFSVELVPQQGVDGDELARRIEAYFDDTYYKNNENFMVRAYNLQNEMASITSVLDTISIAIGIIAGISLLVGGIGVMNIMLVSITERTREIGVRKALGAKNSAIRTQFIVESIIICAIGGVLGILVGMGLGSVGASFLGAPAKVSLSTILGAVGFSMAIGVFFGYYPANKAAKLDPIEALRYE